MTQNDIASAVDSFAQGLETRVKRQPEEPSQTETTPDATDAPQGTSSADNDAQDGNIPTDDQQQSDNQEPLEKRASDLDKKLSYQGKKLAQYEKLALKSVSASPELIHELAVENPKLADEIVSKLWKDEYGISSYKQLQAKIAEVEQENKGAELRDRDPDLYELRKEIEDLKKFKSQFNEIEQEKTWREFTQRHPIFSEANDPLGEKRELLEQEMDYIQGSYNQKLEKAYKIIAGDLGQDELNREAYKRVYAKDTATASGGTNGAVKLEKPINYPETSLQILRSLGKTPKGTYSE